MDFDVFTVIVPSLVVDLHSSLFHYHYLKGLIPKGSFVILNWVKENSVFLVSSLSLLSLLFTLPRAALDGKDHETS